jgi:putative ABC transport system permease protein
MTPFTNPFLTLVSRADRQGGSKPHRREKNAMNELVAANLKHHPGRTAATIAGVAVSVALVTITVGLTRGMLWERGRREANTGVELMLSLPEQQGISLTTLPLSMPVELKQQAQETPGVASVAVVGQHLEMSGESELGLRQIDGVEFESFRQTAGVRMIRGRPLPETGDVVVVDVKYAAAHHTQLGDTIELFRRKFTVIGVFEPETAARIMIPLAVMQQELGAAEKCSMLLVKCDRPDNQEAVAQRLSERIPELRIVFTRDLPRLFAEGYSGVDVFLNTVAGLAALISLLVISLTMYTTMLERTRQIGVLKSLGASKRMIVAVFLKESLVISALGVLFGLLVLFLVYLCLLWSSGPRLTLEPERLALTIAGGLVSGVLGALYPALKAAAMDPVHALNYE